MHANIYSTITPSSRFDFSPFLDRHPGGRELLLKSRDRYEDCTYVFESHHHDYARARKIISKYEVSDAVADKINVSRISSLDWRDRERKRSFVAYS